MSVVRPALALCLVVLALSVRAASPGEDAFHLGFKSYRAGDYASALRSFREAQRAGLSSPQLRYNLGVTYYRLGRYGEAEREFQSLAQAPSWAAIAYYNLGLTAQRMGRTDEAAANFTRAYRESAEPRLRGLAATALERLGVAPPLARTSAFASFGAGYDSNATLSPDIESAGLRGKSDTFAEAIAAVSHRLGGTAGAGLYAQGALYARKYADVSRYDQVGLRAGLLRERRSADRRTGIGGYLEQIMIDNDTLQQAGTLDLHARWPRDAGAELRARYRLTRIEGGDGYRYLDGWQHRLSADAGFPWGRARARAGYELELSERSDLVQGNEFFSYSPTRHTLHLGAVRPAVGTWRAEARVEARFSRHDDPNRLADGSLVRREDDRVGFALRASRPLEGRWRLFVAWEYYDNSSNLETYDYRRAQLSAGVEVALER